MTIRSEVVGLLDPIFGGRVAADRAPLGGLGFPYAIVRDHIAEGVALRGDRRAMAWRRTIQVSVFQMGGEEDQDLLDSVVAVLDGADMPGSTHLSVQSSTRVTDPQPDTVHHAITCSLARLSGTR